MRDRGKRAGATMLVSFDPATIQIPLSRRFSQKDHPRDASFNHHPTGHGEAKIIIDVEGTRG